MEGTKMQRTVKEIEKRVMARLAELDVEIARSWELVAEFEETKKRMEEKARRRIF